MKEAFQDYIFFSFTNGMCLPFATDRRMVLCIHSEVTHGDIFDREPTFLDEIMKPLVKRFPTLKITLEHISTKEAVDYVLASSDNVKASITCHHLLYNRNSKFIQAHIF